MTLLPVDKLLHLGAGAMLAAAGTFIGPAVGAALCAAGALGREWFNVRQGSRFDPLDVLATLAGGLLVLLPWMLKT